MAQEVVFYHSGQAGAPSSTLLAAGALLAVLDACLVNGFNTVGITTLTSSGGVATATTASAHNFSVGDTTVDIAGADQSAYNGRVTILSKPAANQFTYAVSGSPASPATGTITAKHGAAGWTKSVLGTNIAGYRTKVGSSLGHYWQVEDNNPFADSNASFRGRLAEALTATDTAAFLGEQVRHNKRNSNWILVADHKTCYLWMGSISAGSGVGNVTCVAVGEFAPQWSGDQYSLFECRGVNGNLGLADTFPAQNWASNTLGYVSVSLMRGYSNLGSWQPGMHSMMAMNYAGQFIQSSVFPSPVDNSVPMSPIYLFDIVDFNAPATYGTAAGHYRGRARGLYWPVCTPNFNTFNSNFWFKLDAVVIAGVSRTVLLVRIAGDNGGQRVAAVDLGPSWD